MVCGELMVCDQKGLAMKSVSLFGALMLAVSLAACGHSGQAVDGQVLEYGSRAPIAGAIVMARWNGTYYTPWESSTVCGHVETAMTDANGRFHIPTWTERARAINFFMGGGFDYLDVYKADYSYYWWPAYFNSQDFKENILFVQKFKGSREERFKATRVAGVKCPSAGASRQSMLPLYEAIYEQLSTLAVTKEEKYFANAYLNAIEEITLQEAEAERRNVDRIKRMQNEKD